jgi:hypothetical protein
MLRLFLKEKRHSGSKVARMKCNVIQEIGATNSRIPQAPSRLPC